MKSEASFWTSVVESLNPHWKIRLGRGWQAGTNPIAENDFFAYAVDASNGWLSSAALSMKEVRRLMAVAEDKESGLKLAHEVAAQGIHEASRNADSNSQVELESLMLATVMAISKTQTFKLATQVHEALFTHIVYISYRTKDGCFIGRPGALKRNKPGFLEPDEMMSVVRRIVRTDIVGRDSDVSHQIRAGGGAEVAPELLLLR